MPFALKATFSHSRYSPWQPHHNDHIPAGIVTSQFFLAVAIPPFNPNSDKEILKKKKKKKKKKKFLHFFMAQTFFVTRKVTAGWVAGGY